MPDHHNDIPTDWQRIVEGCLRRDRAAQHALYERYFPYGMSVTMRYCDDRQQAVAVLHDAFLKVYRKLDVYDAGKPFQPWFRTIVVRACLDHVRRRAKISTVELDNGITAFDREETLSRIGYEELLAMVHKLTAGYRAVFNLYVIDGFKHEEIAERLGISVGTSKSNLSKARVILQRMVHESLAVRTDRLSPS